MDDSSRAPAIGNKGFMPESREVTGESKELECSNVYKFICLLLNYINVKGSLVNCEMVCNENGTSGFATGLYANEILKTNYDGDGVCYREE